MLKLLVLLLTYLQLFAISDEKLFHAQRSVVSVEVKALFSVSTYRNTECITGIILSAGGLGDYPEGYILTHGDAAMVGPVSTCRIKFVDGSEIDAEACYRDPHIPFAFLKFDATKLPAAALPLELNNDHTNAYTNLKANSPAYVLSRDYGQNFCIQSGIVTKFKEAEDFSPTQFIGLSLRQSNGTAGGLVLDDNGKTLGIYHPEYHNDPYDYFVPICYIQDALKQLLKQELPKRRSLDVNFERLSLEKAQDYYALDAKFIEQYPFESLLVVSRVLPTSTSDFQVGDILYKLNNAKIQPDLYLVEKICNETAASSLEVSVIRDNCEVTFPVELRDLQKGKLQRFIDFSGLIFTEVDNRPSSVFGAPLGKLCLRMINTGLFKTQEALLPITAVDSKTFLEILAINDVSMHNLNDLSKFIDNLDPYKETYLHILYRNHVRQSALFGGYYTYDRGIKFLNLKYLPQNSHNKVYELACK